jgi:hypothetical protein
MAPRPLIRDYAPLPRFVELQMGVVHCGDVGPLLGQAATLPGGDCFSDPDVSRYWREGLSVALAPDAYMH